MATVYIARELEQSSLQRTVALKVMHEHLSRTERFKQRFLDEARLLGRLSHPYICRVFGYGEEDGRPYMAMEYLVGEPLSRVLGTLKHKDHDVSSGDRARLFARVVADLAEGIHSAHETRSDDGEPLGVIHRDVSPQNLFMMYDGTVRVLDFGIAWYRDRYVNTATTSRLIGKLPYMAPEQVRGDQYDRRADVWALGVVLWELVALQRLFRRDTEVQTMEALCFEAVPFISEVTEGIPPGFDNIMARALQRDPEKRYQTAREFAHDLEVWLARTGQPVTRSDASRFLSAFFPGSEQERRRWADSPSSSSPSRQVQQVDFANEALAAFDADPPSLDLLPRIPREQDLVISELAPPNVQANVPREANAGKTYDVESADLLSNPPSTNASPVAISVREPKAKVVPRRVSPGRWVIGGVSVGLSAGLLIGVGLMARQSSGSKVANTITPLAAPIEAHVSPISELEPARAPMLRDAPSPSARVEPPSPTESAPTPRESAAMQTAVATPKATVPPPNQQTRPSPAESKPTAKPAVSMGDVLIVSATRGANVYLGSRLLGQTPLRTRLPVGVSRLSVQVAPDAPRTSVQATVTAERLNVVSVR